MPVPALCFAYSHSYNNYAKIVSASTRPTKLKKIWIKQSKNMSFELNFMEMRKLMQDHHFNN